MFGCWLSQIGLDEWSNEAYNFGWTYLNDGVKLVLVGVGLFVIPEMIETLIAKYEFKKIEIAEHNKQTWEGIIAVWKYKWTNDWWLGRFIGGIMPAVVVELVIGCLTLLHDQSIKQKSLVMEISKV